MSTVIIILSSIIVLFFFVLLTARKKIEKENLSRIVDCMTIAVGISTIVSAAISISVMLSQEKSQERLIAMQENEHQPVFKINYNLSKTNTSEVFDVENFVIENVGEQMLSPADITLKTYIKTNYANNKDGIGNTTYYPLTYYYNASISSENLSGEIMKTIGNEYLHNHLEFYNLYKDAIEYSNTHNDVFLEIEKIDLFKISYIDIYGKERVCYYRNSNRISEKTYDSIIQESNKIYHNVPFKSIVDIGLEDILRFMIESTSNNDSVK